MTGQTARTLLCAWILWQEMIVFGSMSKTGDAQSIGAQGYKAIGAHEKLVTCQQAALVHGQQHFGDNGKTRTLDPWTLYFSSVKNDNPGGGWARVRETAKYQCWPAGYEPKS
jgi:hypothetical protein